MDMINNDGTTAVEDRLSSLPDDIIHHILGFLDLKYAVQTSALSWKWKNVWTFMPQLNLNSHTFDDMKQFSKFVEHALSHRDSCAEVSAVDLTFSASPTHFIIQDIVNYAYSCNVRQMTLEWSGGVGHELPEFFFSSHTLKYLTLDQGFCSSARSHLPKIDWDFPALETLNLTNIRLGDANTKSLDLFSKCLHLKDLTLDNCSMYGLEVFNVSAPQLSNLTITKTTAFPTVFNVASTQLENLTASIISNGGMASCFRFLRLSAEGFLSLEKVNLSLSNGSRCRKEIAVPPLLDLFQVLRNAKLVILDVNIIEVWSTVKQKAELFNVTNDWDSVVDGLLTMAHKRSVQSVVAKLLLAGTSYFIWQERNARLFRQQKRSKDQLINVIIHTVRLKLLTCRFKKTRRVERFLDSWDLPFSLI